MDWSYDLLGERERVLLDRLAVFAAGFDLAAVEEVCSGDIVDRDDIVDVVASLVDKSMVTAERHSSGTRYRLLETVRYYAEGHLVDRREVERWRDRHLVHFLAVARSAAVGWSEDFKSGRGVFDREWDNLRGAYSHALATGNVEAVGRLLSGVHQPAVSLLRNEVGDWARNAVALPEPGPSILGFAASWAAGSGSLGEAERLIDACLTATAAGADPPVEVWLAMYVVHSRAGNDDSAIAALRGWNRAASGTVLEALTTALLAYRSFPSDPIGAAGWADRTESLIATRSHPIAAAEALSFLAIYYGLAGDPQRGVDCCREALAIAEAFDIPRNRNTARDSLARLAASGALENPAPILRQAIIGTYQGRQWADVWLVVSALANWWATQGQLEPATVITGHLDTHGLASVDEPTRQRLAAHTSAQDWLTHGRRLDRDQLIAYILDRLPPATP